MDGWMADDGGDYKCNKVLKTETSSKNSAGLGEQKENGGISREAGASIPITSHPTCP